jgi:hypothetical protein
MLIATLSHQRSGTKLFGSLLESTGAIVSAGEIFNPDTGGLHIPFKSYVDKIGSDAAFAMGSLDVVKNFIGTFAHSGKILHIDVMFNQIEHSCLSWNDYDFPFLYSFLKLRSAVAVLLTRNPVDVFVSNKILQVSAVPHRNKDDTSQPESPSKTLILSRSELRTFRKRIETHYVFARAFFEGYQFFAEIDYSELVEGAPPKHLFTKIEENAHYLGRSFDWRSFPPLVTDLAKNRSDYLIEWTD